MQFQRRVTINLLPQERPAGQMVIQSSSSGKTCQLFIVSKVLTIQCGEQKYTAPDASNIFSAGDETDLWIDVDRGSGSNTPPTWELRLVGRRGRHRIHLLAPDTHLQPPFTLRWGMTQNIQYSFNCMTGEGFCSLSREMFTVEISRSYCLHRLTTEIICLRKV